MTPRATKDDRGKPMAGIQSRSSTKSPVDGMESAEAANLSERMGGLILTEKEASGFIFEGAGRDIVRPSKWSIVGKVFTPRPLKF